MLLGSCRLVAVLWAETSKPNVRLQATLEHGPRGAASNKFQAWLDKDELREKGGLTSGSVGQACLAEIGGPKWAGLAWSKLKG